MKSQAISVQLQIWLFFKKALDEIRLRGSSQTSVESRKNVRQWKSNNSRHTTMVVFFCLTLWDTQSLSRPLTQTAFLLPFFARQLPSSLWHTSSLPLKHSPADSAARSSALIPVSLLLLLLSVQSVSNYLFHALSQSFTDGWIPTIKWWVH